ncbi:GNAT family N-acetyltransferase [Saccharospirillum impatiens]|uniref:GNAT family N-acetyltransferase n=1 Tax=Saccharospirillum impatiens TaxID=169438 RepID=UPI00040A0629|nr:GNAT family N-acetyltransferase [Saccharospirillum impatiens]
MASNGSKATVTDNYTLAFIQPADNSDMATVIRQGLTEFGANRPGFAWEDPELDNLSRAYHGDRTAYWVVRSRGRVVGGCGIGRLQGLDDCCELQKMYISADHRGASVGAWLMDVALDFAAHHYHWCYLETLGGMTRAARLYRRSGFIRLPQPIGQTGHNACDHWYIKELNNNKITG